MTDAATKGDQARAEILDAAHQLFLQNGYNGTSMRAIARAAGDRAVAGLYNHFATKEAIFKCLVEERNPYGELFPLLEDGVQQAESVPDSVRRLLRIILRVMPNHVDFIQLIQIDVREFGGQHIRDLLQEQVMGRLMTILAHFQSLPGLRHIEPLDFFRIMASTVIGFMLTEQVGFATIFGQRSSDEWADLLADTILYGVASQDFRPPPNPPSEAPPPGP